jgi:molybdopterin-guanine dinucleotide biosynthesis protein A
VSTHRDSDRAVARTTNALGDDARAASRPILGICVGGRARRMGGAAKGLLAAPDGAGSLVSRLVALAEPLVDHVVLVGEHEAYRALPWTTLEDAVPDAGPLGGLVALLEHAKGRDVIAIACDMPFVDRALLARLVHEARDAAILSPRRDGRWEPLVARYRSDAVIDAARARLARGELGLQPLLDALDATELLLDDAERARLDDWDSPDDVARPR